MENIFVEFLPPWIETGIQPAFYDKESGTVLQQTARMYARVNMLIRMFNKLSKNTKEEVERFETSVNETVDDYIQRFTELKDFVDDYFDNLDVQEEINNKLDDMVEQGVLQEIITTYIQSNVAWTFDTVADMKSATNLVNGSFAQTLGYYAKNDGGASMYKIRTKTGDDTPDEMLMITIGDNLVAELVFDTTINSKQCGIKGDGTTDETTKLNTFFALSNTYNKILNNGIYLTTGTVFIRGRWEDDLPQEQKIVFDRATIKYTGTNNGCSLVIFNFRKAELNGINLAYTSNPNYVQVIGCWFTSINNMQCKNLKLTTDDTLTTSFSHATNSTANLNFDNLRLLRGTLELNSLTSAYINSVSFYNSTINATSQTYCVNISGQSAMENICFTNCDLSYASDSIVYIAQNSSAIPSINFLNCYFDSNIPLFHNNDSKNYPVSLINNYHPSGKDYVPIEFGKRINMRVLDGHINTANNLSFENVNYAINGDLSSSNIMTNDYSSIFGNTSGTMKREYIESPLNVNNRARKLTLLKVPNNNTFSENIRSVDTVRKGYYTAYIRMKITGTFTEIVLHFHGNTKTFTKAELDSNENLLAYQSHSIYNAGTAHSFYLEFKGVTAADIVMEVYEVGIVFGDTIIPYPKLHELAKI